MFEYQVWFVQQCVVLVSTIYRLSIAEWAGICSIGWVLYQIIERRRLSEANIDRFFRQHFSDKLKSIEDHRRIYLEHFAQAQVAPPLQTLAVLWLAYLRRLLWFLWRAIRLRFNHVSVSHAMLLFESGRRDAAAHEFLKAADQLLETSKLYTQQAKIKKNEAVNALIYGGRVAAMQKDGETTVAAFTEALRHRGRDFDARKLVGEQFRDAGNYSAALAQFDQIIASNATRRDKGPSAEAHRLRASVYREKGDLAEARKALEESLRIEKERESFAGIAESSEQLGDLLAKTKDTIEDARAAYERAIEYLLTLEQSKAARRVRTKLRGLRSEETLLSRLVENFAQYLIEKVASRLRAPAKTP